MIIFKYVFHECEIMIDYNNNSIPITLSFSQWSEIPFIPSIISFLNIRDILFSEYRNLRIFCVKFGTTDSHLLPENMNCYAFYSIKNAKIIS